MMINKNNSFMFKMLISTLQKKISRVFIVLLATMIGASVLIGMITLCYDVPHQLRKEFRSYGANVVFLAANNEKIMNVNEVYKAISFISSDQIVGVTPFRYISVRSNLTPYTLVGVDFSQLKKTSPYWSLEGDYPVDEHQVMVGADIAHFSYLSLGDTIPISGKSQNNIRFEQNFKISGIVSTGKNEDKLIFVDFNYLGLLLKEENQAEVIELSIVATESKLKEYVAQIKKNNLGFAPYLVKWVTQSESTILEKLTSLLYLVTLVIMILTIICVATTMMTTIIERRNEIGLKKALGASDTQIIQEFLLESAILGFIGGLLGSFLGILFAQLICFKVFGRFTNFEFYLIPITTMVSIFINIISSLIPIKQVILVQPALVLRGE